jgi:hypothetical protein
MSLIGILGRGFGLPVKRSGANAGRVQQICEALVDVLDAADTAGAFASTLAAERAYTAHLDLETPVDGLSVLVVPAITTRHRTSNGTWRRDVVIEILVRQHLNVDATIDQASTDAGLYLVEQIDDYLADPDHHELILPDGVIAEYVEPGDERAEAEIRADSGVGWIRDHLLDMRQITGLVRVAYHLDVAY